MQTLTTDVLVVGGGTGGTAAAIQAARRGANTILVSEFAWLGGMLTSAGVSAPDGNELMAWQTGLWGAFLQELQQRQPGGLNHGWVSFFTYEPRVGAEIFADWVSSLPNLTWISGQKPLEVLRQQDTIEGVRFADYTIQAQVILDGTELGDLLALGEVPHRWGWEFQSQWQEPSAPVAASTLTATYPVQAPTWIVVLQDCGPTATAPAIPAPPNVDLDRFQNAGQNYSPEQFLNYGRLPGNRFMINWPIHGNDYGEGVERLIGSASQQAEFLQAALWQSQGFAHVIQTQLGRRYGLANDTFERSVNSIGGGAYALHPYYRESRRLQGLVTLKEQDLLPQGQVAPLPLQVSAAGCEQVETLCNAIAIGNYANDHHYPSGDIPLKAKSIRWGGRWTGTPFTIPYGCLVPETIAGLLVCEKNISVSHMANGATRLQPVVLGIGQAAGMAAALCVEQGCQPQELSVRSLQTALLSDPIAPAAVIPLFNRSPGDPDWLQWQQYYLDHPESYPRDGNSPGTAFDRSSPKHPSTDASLCQSRDIRQSQEDRLNSAVRLTGSFQQVAEQTYTLTVTDPLTQTVAVWSIVTLRAELDQALKDFANGQILTVTGQINAAGQWIVADTCTTECTT